MNNQKEKYFLLYLKTGGGHLAPARSISKYLSEHYPHINPVLVDGLNNAKHIARYIIEDGYRLLQAQAKWYYEFLYATNKFPPIGYFNVAMANFFIKREIKRRIAEEHPTKIVIFHFFLITPVYQVLKELGLDIPVVTVVTDPFTAHPLWFQKKEQQYIVFSERLKKHLLHRRIKEDRIAVFPFIIDEKFSSSLSSDETMAIKEKYGIDRDKKFVLIMGGGDGIPRGKEILHHLLNAKLDIEIAIVAGKNNILYADAIEKQKQFPNLKVFGFIDFVYELLNVSDIVVTKCGASTVMEILMMKKIPIINDYLWEQELGNMEFVRDNNLGIFERNIEKLPSIIRTLTENENMYRSYQQNIEKMNLRNGTHDVGEFIKIF